MTPTRTASALPGTFDSKWDEAGAEESAAEKRLLIRVPLIGECTKDSCRVACHDCTRGNVVGHNAPGTDDGVFSDGDVRKDRRAGSDRCTLLHHRSFHPPVRGGLQLAGCGRGSRIRIVDEHDAVADKHLILNRHTLADERVARNLASPSNASVLLNLDEGPNLGLITHLAAVEVDEYRQLDVFPQLDVRGDADVIS